MKDAYSFHTSQESLQETYDAMYGAYSAIFTRLGLDFRPVLADTGSIGGSHSHEFHVLADSGEDAIAFSTESDYAANIEMAEAIVPSAERTAPQMELAKVATPGKHSIEEVSGFLNVPANQLVKTLIVLGEAEDPEQPAPLVALVVRGDHSLNSIKAEKLAGVASPLTFAEESVIKERLNCSVGSLGPAGLSITVIVDSSAACIADFVCGANRDGFHLTGVNWERDCGSIRVEDIRNVEPGDPSPDGKGTLEIKRGIEVGHIFQLGNKYSQALNASVLNEQGKEQIVTMGCYGIGVSRVVAAAIEQNHDEKGIKWPEALAPFDIALVPINIAKSDRVRELSGKLYLELAQQGKDVLFMDEEKARMGAMLADIELIGIPHTLVIGDRGLEQGNVEYRNRLTGETREVSVDDIASLFGN